MNTSLVSFPSIGSVVSRGMTANLAVEADGLKAALAGFPPRFALRPPLASTLSIPIRYLRHTT